MPSWSMWCRVDHVSGYFHVKLTEGSRTYFGFEWGTERVLCLQRIELRLEAGAVYVYTSFSGEVAGFLRRLALRNLYLLDDSLGAALERLGAEARDNDRRMSAGAAAIVTVSVMVALGYFVHPTKSVLVPALVLRWLGLLVRFGTGVFSVPEDKAVAISTYFHPNYTILPTTRCCARRRFTSRPLSGLLASWTLSL